MDISKKEKQERPRQDMDSIKIGYIIGNVILSFLLTTQIMSFEDKVLFVKQFQHSGWMDVSLVYIVMLSISLIILNVWHMARKEKTNTQAV